MTDSSARLFPQSISCRMSARSARGASGGSSFRIALRLRAAVLETYPDIPVPRVLEALRQALVDCTGPGLRYGGAPCEVSWEIIPADSVDVDQRRAIGIHLVPAASIRDPAHPNGAATTVSTPTQARDIQVPVYDGQRYPPTEAQRDAGLDGDYRPVQILTVGREQQGYISHVFLPVEEIRRGIAGAGSSGQSAFLSTMIAHEALGHAQGERDQPRLGPQSLMYGVVSAGIRRPLRIDDESFKRIVEAALVPHIGMPSMPF